MLSLDTIKQKIDFLSGQIDVPSNLLPTYGTSKDDGSPYIEITDVEYIYLAFDRSIRTLYKKTKDINELLYWVFSNITFTMACSYEAAHHDSKVDSRRKIFSYQLSLLEKLDPSWKSRRGKEVDEILINSPFED